MQRIFDPGCSAEEYERHGKSFPFPDLAGSLCPACRSDVLRGHGYYKRYVISAGFDGILLIRRYICKTCGRTVSLLPSFAHPGRAYGIEPITHVLTGYYAEGRGACETVSTSVCSRQLLRWFRIRIEENINMLIMELTHVFHLRAPPATGVSIKKRVGQFFMFIQRLSATDISLKIFERTQKSYLTPLLG